jgi:hypothetical protein
VSSEQPLRRSSAAIIRYFDVVVVAAVAAPAIVLVAPALGYAIGGGAWIGQRLLQVLDRRWTRRFLEPPRAVAVNLFERFGRIWLLAGAIVVAGVVGGRADGLTAALVIFGAYSIAFATQLFSGGPPRGGELR